MESQVFVVVSLLSESFPAVITLVRLLSGVDPYMIDEVPCLVELPVAVVVLSNEVSQDSSGLLIMSVRSFKIVILHWSNVGFLYVVVFRRIGDPFWVRIIFVSFVCFYVDFLAKNSYLTRGKLNRINAKLLHFNFYQSH